MVRDEAIELLAARVDELLGGTSAPSKPAPAVKDSSVSELVSIGASVGANSHPLLRRHLAAALELGLTPAEVKAAVKMAAYVQQRASEMTAESARHALDQLGLVVGGAAVRS